MENNTSTNHDNGNDANKRLAEDPCKKHKPKQLSYLSWHDWASKMAARGKEQTQCNKCGRWYFKSEL